MSRRVRHETDSLAPHLVYEIEMTSELAHRLARFKRHLEGGLSAQDLYQREISELSGRNADIEALAVHARVLVDFFYGPRQKDDAIAADFFDSDSDWYAVRPKQLGILKRINTRVGKEITHLSYRREAPSRSWSYDLVWRELTAVIRAFVDNVADDRLDPTMRARIGATLATPVTPKVVQVDAAITSSHTEGLHVPTSMLSNAGTAVVPFSPEPPGSD